MFESYEFFESTKLTECTESLEDGIVLEHIGANLELLKPPEMQECNESSDAIWGDPEEDAENWHRQTERNSCAVSCQEFVAEQLTGTEFYEDDLIRFAEKQGWYESQEGTVQSDVGKILEAAGLQVERGEDFTLRDLANELEDGGKIICSVNNRVLENPAYAQMPGVRANHTVQVIGIDITDPNNVEVVLNDPGVKNGGGLRVSADVFLKSWETGNNFAVFARKGAA